MSVHELLVFSGDLKPCLATSLSMEQLQVPYLWERPEHPPVHILTSTPHDTCMRPTAGARSPIMGHNAHSTLTCTGGLRSPRTGRCPSAKAKGTGKQLCQTVVINKGSEFRWWGTQVGALLQRPREQLCRAVRVSQGADGRAHRALMIDDAVQWRQCMGQGRRPSVEVNGARQHS